MICVACYGAGTVPHCVDPSCDSNCQGECPLCHGTGDIDALPPTHATADVVAVDDDALDVF